MSIFRQYPYSKAVRILEKAKGSDDISIIRESIIKFCDYMQLFIEKVDVYTEVFPFISDNKFIFPGKHRELSVHKLETEVYSSGYLSQILSSLNIKNHLELSESLQDAIGELHSNLSRGIKNINGDKKSILEILNNLRNVVQQNGSLSGASSA